MNSFVMLRENFPFHLWFRVALVLAAVPFVTGARPKPGDLMLQEAAAYRSEGRRLQEAGDLKGAQAAYQKAIIVHPRYADTYNDLGVILESQGDLTGAEQAYRSSLQVNPRLGVAHSNLALLYEQQGRVKEAAEHWMARVQMGEPHDPWVIKAREKLMQYKVPIPESPQVLAKKRKLEAATFYETGRQAMREKKWQEAIDHFERALALDPAHERTQSSLEAAQSQMKKTEGARSKALSAAQEQALKKAEGRSHPSLPPPAPAPSRPMVSSVVKPAQAQVAKPPGVSRVVEPAESHAKLVVVKPIVQPEKEKQAVPAPKEAQELAKSLAGEKEEARKETIRELMQQAVQDMRQGHYQEAAAHFDKILLLDPDHREATQGLKRAQAALQKAAKKPAA